MPSQEVEGRTRSPDYGLTNLERCLACKHGKDKDANRGSLTCRKHDMLINADVDEIPDDCPDFEREEMHSAASAVENPPKRE